MPNVIVSQLFRSNDDPNDVIMVFEWSDLDSARQFGESEDLKRTVKRAEVANQPSIYFVEEVERPAV